MKLKKKKEGTFQVSALTTVAPCLPCQLMYPKTNALPNYSDLTSSNLNNKTFFFHLEHFLVVLSIFEVEAKVRKQADINGQSYFDIYEKTAIIAINKDRSQEALKLNAICV